MTKEKRMEPPRLSLVPSSQENNDNGRDDAGDEPVRAGALPRNVAALPFADHREKLRILEALLFAASEPLDEAKLAAHLADAEEIGALIEELRAFYAGRGVNLVKVAGKWAFRTAEDLAYLLERYATQERRLSKAALETLSIVAYHQPVTRAEIEEIRGVTTSAGTLDILLGNRLGASARPPPCAGPPRHVWHDRCVPLPLRSRKHQGSARPRRVARLRAARRQSAARLHRPRPHRPCLPDARRAAARSRRG